MKKILLALTLLAAGLTTNVNAATKVKTIDQLNQILNNNKGAALTNISITNAYLSVPPTMQGDNLMKAGYKQDLTTDQVNLLLSQEQTNAKNGSLAVHYLRRISYTYLKKIDTSSLNFNDDGTLYFTINFTCANLQYSFTSSCAVSGNRNLKY